MNEATHTDGPERPANIPPEIAAQVRVFLHDLSNALEIVIQSHYLLSTAADGALAAEKEWLGLLERGAQQAVRVNQELRDYVRHHS
jgi:hypothetical protein